MELTDKQLREILEELYAIDPMLSKDEQALTDLVKKFAGSKPQVDLDTAFKGALRMEILKKIGMPEQPARTDNINSFTQIFFMKKTTYVTLGAALTFVIMLVAFGYIITGNRQIGNLGNLALKNSKQKAKLAFDIKINPLGEHSFGVLASEGTAKTAKDATLAAPLASGFGRGGGNAVSSSGAAESSGSAAIQKQASSIDRIMPPYEPVIVKYLYKGGEIKVDGDKMEVLKRVKGSAAPVSASDMAASLNFGAMNLTSFSNLDLQSINFIQRGDQGYIISVMMDEGSVSIGQNWEAWPMGKCLNDEKCYQAQMVKQADIPADEELIRIASSFLSEHGISTSNYGEPEITDYWKTDYARSADKDNYYFPEQIDVIYPLKINGKYVYDEYSGTKQGMNVSVHIKTRKVASVYNLNTQQYESSAYDVETDPQKLISLAEKGGSPIVYYMGGSEQGKTVEAELGDPEAGYMKYWSYKDGKSAELLVPALVFPIKKVPEGADVYKKAVVVPLVKDIIKEREGNIAVPTPLDTVVPQTVPSSDQPVSDAPAAATMEGSVQSAAPGMKTIQNSR